VHLKGIFMAEVATNKTVSHFLLQISAHKTVCVLEIENKAANAAKQTVVKAKSTLGTFWLRRTQFAPEK
jgi:hypothetical protein